MAHGEYQPRYYKTTAVDYPKYRVIVKRRVAGNGYNLPEWGEDMVVVDRFRTLHEPGTAGATPAGLCRHFITLPGVVRVCVMDRDGNAAEIELPEEP